MAPFQYDNIKRHISTSDVNDLSRKVTNLLYEHAIAGYGIISSQITYGNKGVNLLETIKIWCTKFAKKIQQPKF